MYVPTNSLLPLGVEESVAWLLLPFSSRAHLNPIEIRLKRKLDTASKKMTSKIQLFYLVIVIGICFER